MKSIACFVSIVCIVIIFISCSSEEESIPVIEVGQDFTNSNIRVMSIDTFSVELSTYKLDSVITSSTNRLLIGQYTDAIFGTVKSGSYLEFTPIEYDIPDDAELDSIALVLNYDGYFYSDTTKVSSIHVHKLSDEVVPEEDAFYNTSTIAYEEVPISSVNYYPRPYGKDSLHISIPIGLGQELFNQIRDNSITSDIDLRNELKGLALLPGETDDSSVIGFSIGNEETYLRFFYTIVDSEFEEDEQTYDLIINSSETYPTYFNAISSASEGTYFEPLIDQEINLPSSDANNRSYIQAGVGLITKIELPSIKNIYQISGTGTLMSAALTIKPPPQVYDDLKPISDSLFVNTIDQNNDIGAQLINGNGEVYALLNESNKEFNEIVYEIPLGVYVEDELSETPEIENAIAIFPQNFNNTVDQIVLEGENSDDFEAELIITYAIYDENE
ncbi:hypothetical protein GCM10022393_11140 [Aquimarina addita]|uniref:DUF4270 family protein n=1 Tax=Aquimarina addita TaxID=870485 RepID=A0ABP7XDG3_9FLAO